MVKVQVCPLAMWHVLHLAGVLLGHLRVKDLAEGYPE